MSKLKKGLILLILLLCFFFLPFKFTNINQYIHIVVCTDGVFVYLYSFPGSGIYYPNIDAHYGEQPMVNLADRRFYATYLDNAHSQFDPKYLNIDISTNNYFQYFISRAIFYIDDIELCSIEYVNHSTVEEYSTLKPGDPCIEDNLCKDKRN